MGPEISTVSENAKPPGVGPGGCKNLCLDRTSNQSKRTELICLMYSIPTLETRALLPQTGAHTLRPAKAAGWQRLLNGLCTGQPAFRSGASGMRNSPKNVHEFLAVTIRLHGRDAERVIYAAGMACKSPEQYLTDMAKWNGRLAEPQGGAA